MMMVIKAISVSTNISTYSQLGQLQEMEQNLLQNSASNWWETYTIQNELMKSEKNMLNQTSNYQCLSTYVGLVITT